MFSVLDAVGIRYGSSHGEAIVVNGEPVLVEVGARMHGLSRVRSHGLKGPMMTQAATGVGIHELVADVLVNDGRMHKEMHERNWRYVMKKFVFESMLNNTTQPNPVLLSSNFVA